MKLKFKFFNPNNWGLVKVYRDVANYLDWARVIKRERVNPNSEFNKLGLENNMFYNVYLTISVEEAPTDTPMPENIRKYRLIESLNPVHRYLDDTLGFSECLVPEFNQFVDDEGNETSTYLIVYRFAFNKLSLKWVLKWIFILVLFSFLVHKYNLIHILQNWISSI